jgi:hypothetical protein
MFGTGQQRENPAAQPGGGSRQATHEDLEQMILGPEWTAQVGPASVLREQHQVLPDVGELMDVEGRTAAEAVEKVSRPPFVLGHQRVALGEVGVRHHRGYAIHVAHQQTRGVEQGIVLVASCMLAEQLPCDLAADSERPQEVLEPDPLGCPCAGPLAQRVEVAVRRDHAGLHPPLPAPQVALDALGDVALRGAGKPLEGGYFGPKRIHYFSTRLNQGDPGDDCGDPRKRASIACLCRRRMRHLTQA